MGDIEKRLNKASVIKAAPGTAWGTAEDTDLVGTGILPLNSGAPKLSVTMLEDESNAAFEVNLDVGLFAPVDFGLDFDYRYSGRENLLLAMLMGTAGVPGMYFVVSNANHHIDFEEAAGGEKNAVITNGTYTATALCAEIKVRLEALSNGILTYTVTHNATTRKFTIATSANFALPWNSGTNNAAAADTLLGFAADLAGAATYTSSVAAVGLGLNYLHSLSLSNSVATIFGTYATEKGSKVHAVPSFKVTKGAFSLSGGLIKVAFNIHGNKVIDTSGLTFATTTIPAGAHYRAKFSQAVFQMNAQAGADFDGGGADIVRPKSFSLEIERKMDAEHVAGDTGIIEPIENDKPQVKLTLEFPRMDAVNAAYFTEWIAGTEKKADLVITGPVIEGAYAYYIKFQFPRLIIEDVEYADSKVIPAKIVLRGVTADTAPTGMTVPPLTLPVYIQIMNILATDLLA